MDKTTLRIARFASSLRFEDIPAPIVHQAKKILIDSLACGAGGRDCQAAMIGRRVAAASGPHAAKGRVLFGSEGATFAEASFINSCMIRDLDFNDTYPGLHPSDGLGGLLALVDGHAISPELFLSAMAVLYEVSIRTAKAGQFRELGWDQGFNTAVGLAAAVGHMLRLSEAQIANAVSIAAVANNHLRATRAGNLSAWKGAAAGYAASSGVMIALLAAEGMTGPESPFEGRHGLREQVSKDFSLLPLPTEGGEFFLKDVRLKFWPVEYHAQIGVWAALELRKLMPLERIGSIRIGTYWSAWQEIGSEPAKWDPQHRETADHSLPYIFAKALVDGSISLSSFDDDQVRDPSIRTVMKKIGVGLDDEINAMYPKVVPMKVEVTDLAGKSRTVSLTNPRGHELNPMSDDEVSAKFRRLAQPVLKGGTEEALSSLWELDSQPDLSSLLDRLLAH